MVTVHSSDTSQPNRTELVNALQTLVEHYTDEAGSGGPAVAAAKMTVASVVTAYAMGQLMRRLVVEGYVREERKAELAERALNLECGRGFVTDRERNTPTQAAPPPKPKTAKKIADELADFE